MTSIGRPSSARDQQIGAQSSAYRSGTRKAIGLLESDRLARSLTVEVIGAAQLYRAAPVLTPGLGVPKALDWSRVSWALVARMADDVANRDRFI